jgi:hypothetical protein
LCAKAAARKRPTTKEETVKAFKTYLVIATLTVLAVAAVPVAHAGNPTSAQLRALQIRGQAMNTMCESSTLSREGYVALCGTKGSQHQPTAAALQAYEIRGRAMNAMSRPTVSGGIAAALRALAIRGQGMQALSESATLSREGYTALFGTQGAEQQPTRAELHALQIRSQGMQDLSQSPTLSREAYVALFGTQGAEHQPTAAELHALQIRGQAMNRFAVNATTRFSPANPFEWREFGFGAAAALGFVLLTGGIWAGLHYGRKPGAPPHTVS